ncbi:hypothetical protein DL89DRAFT_51216 [Linderina pennispora]|uniref:Uncharacterized protein n=1 Tax=Linderina pennispora TaxID=61395 RepID=A0A1Y1W0N9_9FUNG|nr:uncharacterized protein DL89DRAFT_51216 [Linderina pennispora]ORX67042.1 hypothetical protein DL89DRAFT_51216 [Linderina pennispora]
MHACASSSPTTAPELGRCGSQLTQSATGNDPGSSVCRLHWPSRDMKELRSRVHVTWPLLAVYGHQQRQAAAASEDTVTPCLHLPLTSTTPCLSSENLHSSFSFFSILLPCTLSFYSSKFSLIPFLYPPAAYCIAVLAYTNFQNPYHTFCRRWPQGHRLESHRTNLSCQQAACLFYFSHCCRL